ncbi:MAG: hypothetical protein HKN68_20385 [Saprospiraceae bacterium]|nr:hypothetical protein [Saprospiraceae bacterium]
MTSKYLIFDATPISKPRDYKAPFSDTFAWPRLIHLSWIMLNEDFKPVSDYDCIINPEGFSFDENIQKYAKVDKEDIDKKGAKLEDVLEQFTKCIDDTEYVFAHNLNVSENVVAAEFLRKGINHNLFKAERFCLMQESTWYCKLPSKTGGYKWPTLRELHAVLFNQAYSPAGNARADVIAASRCFIMLMKLRQLEDLFDDED